MCRRTEEVGPTVGLPICRHMYDWNIVNCDVKQPIHLTQCIDNECLESNWNIMPKQCQNKLELSGIVYQIHKFTFYMI